MDMATVFYFALNKFLSSNVSKMLANIWSGIENPNQSTSYEFWGATHSVLWLQPRYKVYYVRT